MNTSEHGQNSPNIQYLSQADTIYYITEPNQGFQIVTICDICHKVEVTTSDTYFIGKIVHLCLHMKPPFKWLCTLLRSSLPQSGNSDLSVVSPRLLEVGCSKYKNAWLTASLRLGRASREWAAITNIACKCWVFYPKFVTARGSLFHSSSAQRVSKKIEGPSEHSALLLPMSSKDA